MREIKYRAYNPDTKAMSKPFGFGSIVSHGQVFQGDNCFSLYPDYNDTPAIVEQFTGLKDSKDVDIYEGDIVRVWWGSGSLLEHVEDITNLQMVKGLQDSHPIEIIGNIHENPELLK